MDARKSLQSGLRCCSLFALVASILCTGCADNAPFRTKAADDEGAGLCMPDQDGRVDAAKCGRLVHEVAPDVYDLSFIEFDDHGLQFPARPRCADPGSAGAVGQATDGSQSGTWIDQSTRAHWSKDGDSAMGASHCFHRSPDAMHDDWDPPAYTIVESLERLNELFDEHRKLTVFVYVHGWKHNAASNDDNVRKFRQLLWSAAQMERQGRTGAHVVGIYVGWRGHSISAPVIDNLTFWTRKSTAMQVAQGSVRELFARLRTFRCIRNANLDPSGKSDLSGCDSGNTPTRDLPVRLIIVGHSFGGLIVYNAVSPWLIESMTEAHSANIDDCKWIEQRPVRRFADLVVLLNPAFEATRYTPLHRIWTTECQRTQYEPPLLISVTGTADWATRIGFPIGRWVSTRLEADANREETDANMRTLGHMSAYVSHALNAQAPGTAGPTRVPETCPGWQPRGEQANAGSGLEPSTSLIAEARNARAWRQAHADGFRTDDSRVFCSGAVLKHVALPANGLVWNVIADPAVIPDHNSVTGELLWNFLREVYFDVVFRGSQGPADVAIGPPELAHPELAHPELAHPEL